MSDPNADERDALSAEIGALTQRCEQLETELDQQLAGRPSLDLKAALLPFLAALLVVGGAVVFISRMPPQTSELMAAPIAVYFSARRPADPWEPCTVTAWVRGNGEDRFVVDALEVECGSEKIRQDAPSCQHLNRVPGRGQYELVCTGPGSIQIDCTQPLLSYERDGVSVPLQLIEAHGDIEGAVPDRNSFERDDLVLPVLVRNLGLPAQ